VRATRWRLGDFVRAVGFDVIAVVLVFAAWRQTYDLQWPCENDLFRDLGAAQSIVDGQGGADPAYLGERWWYNPLVPGIVGVVGRTLGIPLHEAYARLGTHLNLIAPLGLYAMMAVLLTRRAALAGLIGFLFLGPHGHISWLHATYSPWLWTCNFSQGLLYGSILLLVWTLRRRKPLLGIAAGLSVGLTLLAHTAPGFVIGFALLVVTGGEIRLLRREPRAAKRALAVAAIVGAVAATVAWPFWNDVFEHVQRGVRNPAPMQWVAAELDLRYLPQLVEWHESLRGSLALIGLVHLFFRARHYCRHTRRALLGWGLAVAVGLAYGYASQRMSLPTLLPSWHFYFYLHALESVLFGVGVAALGAFLVRVAIDTRYVSRFSRNTFELAAHVACIVPLLLYSGLNWDRYRRRMDLVDNRGAALESAKARTVELYRWILNNTEPDAVFLADGEASFYAVASAGRKVVAMQDLFSNPYIDVAQRAREAAVMFEHMRSVRWSEFSRIAGRYQLKYVALPIDERERLEDGAVTALRRVFTAADARGWDVYQTTF
jgi:hypothetical protein